MIATVGGYPLTSAQARAIVDEVVAVTSQWRSAAARAGIARADVELTAVAFEHADAFGG